MVDLTSYLFARAKGNSSRAAGVEPEPASIFKNTNFDGSAEGFAGAQPHLIEVLIATNELALSRGEQNTTCKKFPGQWLTR
ncbi:hypothetical protein [Agrobacterium sp. CG674]